MTGSPPNPAPIGEITGEAPLVPADNRVDAATIAQSAPATEPLLRPAQAPTDIAPAAAAPLVAAEVTGAAEQAATGIGVLLVNLGTPDAATPAAVRRYLKEFLSDRRVIEKDSLLWKLVLNGIILPIRSRRKARDYQKIWNRDKNESPFKTITRSQAEKLARHSRTARQARHRRLGDALCVAVDCVAAAKCWRPGAASAS